MGSGGLASGTAGEPPHSLPPGLAVSGVGVLPCVNQTSLENKTHFAEMNSAARLSCPVSEHLTAMEGFPGRPRAPGASASGRDPSVAQSAHSYRQRCLLNPQAPHFSVISELCSDTPHVVAFCWSKDPNLGDYSPLSFMFPREVPNRVAPL